MDRTYADSHRIVSSRTCVLITQKLIARPPLLTYITSTECYGTLSSVLPPDFSPAIMPINSSAQSQKLTQKMRDGDKDTENVVQQQTSKANKKKKVVENDPKIIAFGMSTKAMESLRKWRPRNQKSHEVLALRFFSPLPVLTHTILTVTPIIFSPWILESTTVHARCFLRMG